MPLGDAVGKALAIVGITDERVSAWVGSPCRCPERRAKLNALHGWAARILAGRTRRAAEYLDGIMGEDRES